MCFFKKMIVPKTIEEIVAEKSKGMSPAEKAEYWYELNQSIFALLGKVDVTLTTITPGEWLNVAQTQYPTLTDAKIADSVFYVVWLNELIQILTLDWSNLVPYVAEIGDCDKFATRLYSHLCDFYKINSVVPVWGETTQGYHGFNLAVTKDMNKLTARLIEPQGDQIFVNEGPMGRYTPQRLAIELGIKRIGG